MGKIREASGNKATPQEAASFISECAVAVEKANGKTPEPDAAAIADEMARQDAAGAAKH